MTRAYRIVWETKDGQEVAQASSNYSWILHHAQWLAETGFANIRIFRQTGSSWEMIGARF